MKAMVEGKYPLKVEAIIKLSQNVHKIFTDKGIYIFKYHKDQALESIFSRINMLHLETFLLPILSNNGIYIENQDTLFFSLSPFLVDEISLNKDIRLRFYIKALAQLHVTSHYTIKVGDSFFDESLNYLDKMCDEVKAIIDARIERVERLDYKSPSDWYFLMNYDHLNKAIQEAHRHIDSLEEAWKSAKGIHLSLTYQNFDYLHIIVKYGRIISLDKMAIAPSIYDLKELFDIAYLSKIDITNLMQEYLSINPLQTYEKEWLLAFLFIPKVVRFKNDIDDIGGLFKTLNHLNVVEEFATILLGNADEQEKPIEDQEKPIEQ